MSWWILFALGLILALGGMLITWMSEFAENTAVEDLMASSAAVIMIIGAVVIAFTLVSWTITEIIAVGKSVMG